MILDELESEITQIVQERPYTMIQIRHIHNGVTYLAYGFSCCQYPDKWDEDDGITFAWIRASRKIAKRLRWEVSLCQQVERSAAAHRKASGANIDAAVALRDVSELHADGGTVRL